MDAESYSLQFTTETGITGAQSAPAGPGEGPRWTLVGVADELLVHYRGGVGKSNEKGGGGPLEVGTWKPEGGI